MPHEVIMPALGMAQETGQIIAWLKTPGEAVKLGEPLMEIETDKATMEIEAQGDGYLTEVRAAAGEAVPVGQVVALIAERPEADDPAQAAPAQAATGTAAAAAAAAPTQRQEPAAEAPAAPEAGPPAAAAGPAAGGRILASPKARRLAAEEGLDLARLVAEGHHPPFHVKDLQILRALPGAAPATAAAPGLRLRARVAREGFAAFADWLAAETGAAVDRPAIWAAFAAAAFRDATGRDRVTLRVERPGLAAAVCYTDPDLALLGGAEAGGETAAPAGVILRDLTHSAITGLSLGGGNAPVLTVTDDGADFALTLEAAAVAVAAEAAVALVSGFAARLDDPTRHLM